MIVRRQNCGALAIAWRGLWTGLRGLDRSVEPQKRTGSMDADVCAVEPQGTQKDGVISTERYLCCMKEGWLQFVSRFCQRDPGPAAGNVKPHQQDAEDIRCQQLLSFRNTKWTNSRIAVDSNSTGLMFRTCPDCDPVRNTNKVEVTVDCEESRHRTEAGGRKRHEASPTTELAVLACTLSWLSPFRNSCHPAS
jgi:hypothetical protein